MRPVIGTGPTDTATTEDDQSWSGAEAAGCIKHLDYKFKVKHAELSSESVAILYHGALSWIN